MSDDRLSYLTSSHSPPPWISALSSLGSKGPFCGFQKKQQEEMGIG